MNRIAHFEIHADDPERAAKFYKEVFGWDIQKWEGGSMEYWMVMTAPKESAEPGINGGLMRRMGAAPADGAPVSAYVCTVQVENIDAVMAAIENAGGKLALPKFAIPGMAWQAYYKDTEGNIFGIHQPDTQAK